MRKLVVATGLLLLGAAGALVASLPHSDDPFPHEAHAGLFPVCVGCHAGVETGAPAELFPEPARCGACHDGVRAGPVDWSPPAPRPSTLTFFHAEHRDLVELAGEEATCETCHADDEPPVRMRVARAAPEDCLACHAHEAASHLASEADCAACHIPLTGAKRLPTARIAGFPRPASHDAPGFVSSHAPETAGELASCATCHARDTCVRCHVNADRLEAVGALEPDERVASLERGREAEYPLPETHTDPGWSWAHGPTALSEPARCANCHTAPSCAECHVGAEGPAADLVAELPSPVPGGAPGVDLSGSGAGVHPADFAERHAPFAAAGALQCSGCHAQQYCVSCHVGTEATADIPVGASSTDVALRISLGSARDFHPENFLERHAVESFAGSSDCQSCHSTEAFCRDCHAGSGLASSGRLDTAFHTAEPLWLIAHGQAARMGLESCASCHAQTDCLACHSTIRGRGVSPHGPGFDADRMAGANRVTCRWCHLGAP